MNNEIKFKKQRKESSTININKMISISNCFDLRKSLAFKILCIIILSKLYLKKNCSCKNNFGNISILENSESKLIEENFFIIDSNKQLGFYANPDPQGVFVMIQKIGKEIRLYQDFHGSFGIYIYENKKKNYFALSNSFLLLEEYLIGKQNISFNKEYADNLIISYLYTYSVNETLIKEIKQLPSNTFIIIDIMKKSLKIKYIDYKENSIPLESEEGLKIIDKWVDKWGYIIRSLKKKTDNISCDLSGGLDTRSLLSVILNSGINLNDILVKSATDKKHGHQEDFKIANNISSKYGFKLNNVNFDIKGINWNSKESLLCTLYSKLGFHKEFYLKNRFLINPKFSFTGNGGEELRGSPGYPIEEFIEKISSETKIPNHEKEFYNSSRNIMDKSISFLKQYKSYSNDYEISYDLDSKLLGRNHFGRSALEAFMANVYQIQPLMDPDLKKINYKITGKLSHDLIAYIYVRFSPGLINFPIQGNRKLNSESIIKAKLLNNKEIPYKLKSNYNKYFFIDKKRNSPVNNKKDNITAHELLKEFFNSSEYFKIINEIYDKNIYDWIKEYRKKSNYHPMRHDNGLLAIIITKKLLDLNERYMNNMEKKNYLKDEMKIVNNIFQ